jgi:hypothetical protein
VSFVPLPTISSQGSWGGKGTQKQAPKPFLIKKVAGIDPKSRADYGKAHVIISEKRDKKAAKYLVKDLPYPYTSKEQFERSLSTPLGTEWNTRVGFQRGTLPKVVMKVSLTPYPNALLQLLMLALLAGNDYQPIGEVGMIPHAVDTSSIPFANALPLHDSLLVTLHECVDRGAFSRPFGLSCCSLTPKGGIPRPSSVVWCWTVCGRDMGDVDTVQ